MFAYIVLFLCVMNICFCDESDKNLFPLLPVAPVTSENEQCKADSVMYLENLDNITLWSYQMWEASAKSTAGLLQGNKYHMGDWYECMEVKGPFKTRFCLVVVKANIAHSGPVDDLRISGIDPQGSVLKRILQSRSEYQLSRDEVKIGWCVPASCTNDNLNDVLEDHFNRSNTILMQHNVTYSGIAIEKLCQTQGEVKSFDALDIVFCAILGVLLFIVIIATIYESKIAKLTENEKQEYQKHMGRRILSGFSARKNFKDLVKADTSNPALSVLYGLRTVTTFFVICSHKFLFHNSGPLLNFDVIETYFLTIPGCILLQVTLLVDTYFILSGTLATYGLMKQFEKKVVNPFHSILSRYIRLTPAYAFVILFYVTVFNFMGTGPLWKSSVQQESEDCKNNWWTNLLYVNNYVNVKNICIIQSWYLACDYHYYIIAVFIVLLFWKNKMLGSILFIVCFLLSFAVPFIVTAAYMRSGIFVIFPDYYTHPKDVSYFVSTYVTSHARASPYCIGMIMGYIYYKMKDNEKPLSKIKSHSITVISILLLVVAVTSNIPFYNPYHKYNALEAGAYEGFNRLAWSFGTMGLLLTASLGHATVIQKVLSWSPFVPLSKLTYGVYLIHATVQYRSLGMTLTPQRFDMITMVFTTLGDSFVALVAALVLYLLIEVPMRKLFQELLESPGHATSKPRFKQESIIVNKYRRRPSNAS